MISGKKGDPDLEFSGPAIYRIVVQGLLGEGWSGRLAGMEITAVTRGTGAPYTELRGPVRDQPELSSVLETLHDLHLPLVKVEQADEPE